ncbi:MAG TPA: helix-turn-helix domain-containing protein [Solirubrobacterales bacterium]|jgi:AcrR family transcriptional regulator
MSELVYEDGYGQVTIRDLLARAHVTKPTFYRLFAGKEDCFASAYDEAATGLLTALATAAAARGTRLELVCRVLQTFVEVVVRYPEGSYLGLLETLSVGAAATARMRRTEDELVGLAVRSFAATDDPVALPGRVGQGVIAGVGRLARERLKERPEAFRDDIDELAHWVLSITDPEVEGLADLRIDRAECRRGGSRFDGGLRLPMSEERALLIRSTIGLAADVGYEPLSARAIAAAAGLSRRDFDAEFDGVEDCLTRALEVGTVTVVAEVRSAFEAAPDWAHGIHRAIEALCAFFVSEPGMTRLTFVEAFVPGRAVTRRGSTILTALARLLRDRMPSDLPLGAVSAEASVGAIFTLLRKQVDSGVIADIPCLAPTLAWLVLSPSIGGPAAIAVLDDARRPDRARR